MRNEIQDITLFEFCKISIEEMKNEINRLNPKTKVLKLSLDTSAEYLTKIFNDSLTSCIFPDELKVADITPIFKKRDPTIPNNYRPISVLPVVSKLFERILQKQMYAYMNHFLSPYLCGYRNGFTTQQALLSLIEKWKNILDKKGFGGAILMDLSKAFDTLDFELLIAKLHTYGFQKKSLKFIYSYLCNRWYRTKVNTDFSSWSALMQGVPQGSVLGPLLFNIYLNDLFFLIEFTNVCNFADDTTFYACDDDVQSLVNRLEHDSYLAIEWFENNYMKLNPDKCHLLIAGHKFEIFFAQISEVKIWESSKQKLLGVLIDRNLKFDEYVSSMCDKAGQKMSILIRQSNCLNLYHKRY